MIHLFKNWRYVRSVEKSVNLLQALSSFQYQEATFDQQMFTALDTEQGLAFSQWYRRDKEETEKLGKPMARHGVMFKHEPGQINPEAPSYDDLMRAVPVSEWCNFFSIYTRKDAHQVLGFKPLDGKSPLDQCLDYARANWNDPKDVPLIYELTPVAYKHVD